ncbi:MAG: amidohydrolase [Firmicutes bacterium]|jgi:imidazolonepropionase-like amidohydrolase|nr:amidohydrolase [Bacillota bacterium]
MILLKNGTVYTMENGILENCDIQVKDGKIEKIGSDLPSVEAYEVIDCEGKLVFPGFIDAHTHLGMWEDSIGFEGADGNEMTDPITPHLRAIDAINPMDRNFDEALEGGVTSCASGPGSANIIGGTFAAIKTAGNVIDKMIIKNDIAMKCAFGENPKRIYNSKNKAPMTRMSIAGEFRATLYKAKEYMNKKDRANGDVEKMPAFDMKLEALIPVLRREIPLKAHAHRADDIMTAMRIAKEFDTKLTLEHCTEGHLIWEEILENNMVAVVGPSFGERSKFELKNLTFETPGILAKNGVKIAIMTDHPVIPLHHLNLMASLAVKSGLDYTEALKAITINAAEILELDDRIGSIKEGKDADIVVWDNDPLDVQSKVLYTIVDGKVAYKA